MRVCTHGKRFSFPQLCLSWAVGCVGLEAEKVIKSCLSTCSRYRKCGRRTFCFQLNLICYLCIFIVRLKNRDFFSPFSFLGLVCEKNQGVCCLRLSFEFSHYSAGHMPEQLKGRIATGYVCMYLCLHAYIMWPVQFLCGNCLGHGKCDQYHILHDDSAYSVVEL